MSETSGGRIALTNGRIILPDAVVSGKALLVEGPRIAAIVAPDELGEEIERVDVGGRYLSPGLVDIHIHGALGYTFNDASREAFRTITQETGRRGVTSLLVTTAAAPRRDLLAILELSRAWMGEAHPGCSQVVGVHVEGPYFDARQAGAMDPSYILDPDDEMTEQLLAYREIIRIFTFAPELPGALALTTRLVELGIVAAAGHSMASDRDVLAAIERGLSHIIHIWSAQSTTYREGPWRRPGLLETTLAYDGFTAEMISDNRHLPATLMKLAYKCLGPDRLCAISDATSGAGLPEGSRFRMGTMEYEVCDGVGMMFDRSAFAGSVRLLDQMIRVLTDVVEIPLPEAVRMASLTPARVIGLDGRKGSLEAGKDADIAIFEEDFTAWRTMIAGQWLPSRPTDSDQTKDATHA